MDSNKGFNLSSQLLAAVSFDVFLSFPLLFFFPYLFHRFSIARIPSGCVCMHLAVGREGEEESQFFSPSGPCFDFPKLWGGSSCLPAEGSALGAVSAVGTSRPASAPTGEGWARVVAAFLSRWSVQLWSKQGAHVQPDNAFLLCFQPCQCCLCFIRPLPPLVVIPPYITTLNRDGTRETVLKGLGWSFNLGPVPTIPRGLLPARTTAAGCTMAAGFPAVVGSQVCGHLGGTWPHRPQKV